MREINICDWQKGNIGQQGKKYPPVACVAFIGDYHNSGMSALTLISSM